MFLLRDGARQHSRCWEPGLPQRLCSPPTDPVPRPMRLTPVGPDISISETAVRPLASQGGDREEMRLGMWVLSPLTRGDHEVMHPSQGTAASGTHVAHTLGTCSGLQLSCGWNGTPPRGPQLPACCCPGVRSAGK